MIIPMLIFWVPFSYKSHLHMKFAKIQYFLHFLGEFTFYYQKLERKAHVLT
jgi:hypothetical protein